MATTMEAMSGRSHTHTFHSGDQRMRTVHTAQGNKRLGLLLPISVETSQKEYVEFSVGTAIGEENFSKCNSVPIKQVLEDTVVECRLDRPYQKLRTSAPFVDDRAVRKYKFACYWYRVT